MSEIVSRDEAVRLLRTGGVVAVPTDTVYGVAASVAHPMAVANLFAMKHRPTSMALPVLIDSFAAIELLEVTWPENARRLSEAFWPGALTIVVSAPRDLARLVGSTTDTVGFRVPNDELLVAVLRESGPLAVTSANEHGETPCQRADQVLRTFADLRVVNGVLDGGERAGDVSTVIEVRGSSWRILREGAISAGEVARVLA